MQVVRVEVEDPSRFGDVATGIVDGVEDQLLLGCADLVVKATLGKGFGIRRFEKGFGKIFRTDDVFVTEHQGSFDGIREFANIAWPGMAGEELASFGGEGWDRAFEACRVKAGEVVGQQRNVALALS